jgi:hypothetical protein
MTTRHDPDHPIAAWLQHEVPDGAPERLLAASRSRISSTQQRRAPLSWRAVGRLNGRAKLAVAMTAAVAVAVAGLNILPRLGGDPNGVGQSPLATSSADASPGGSSALATPEVSQPAVLSLDLTWTEVDIEANLQSGFGSVAWLGDRFVLLEDSGAISASIDGVSWAVLQPGDPDPGYAELLWGRASFVSWEDTIIGWWNPEDGPDVAGKPPITARDILRIVRPPAEPTETTPFKGRIESIGIGPAGIVAQVHSHIDWDAWVATRLGEDWVSHYTGVDYQNGILDIGMDNGPGLHVNWADEGFEPGDYQDNGFGWFSPDGEQWTAMPFVGSPGADESRGFATGFGDVLGVSDGFIARGIDSDCASEDGCAGMWHSADGLTWRNIGNVPLGPNGHEGSVLPWMGGALVADGVGNFDVWTSDGPSELPMAAELPAAWTQTEASDASVEVGPLGLVTVLKDGKQILVSRDGVDWKIQPMPEAMAAGQTLVYGAPTVVVGDRSVLVVVWSGSGEARIPTFWVGAPTP